MRKMNTIVTKENAKELRLQAMEEVKANPSDTKEGKIMDMLITAWGEWQPDYEGWVKWSDGLYTADSTINAIGGEQRFRDYQASMKEHGDGTYYADYRGRKCGRTGVSYVSDS